MNKIKALIFDLDGVIVSTDEFHYKAWKHMADKYNLDFNEDINQKLRGVSRMESLEIILDFNNKKYGSEEKEKMILEKNTLYVSLLESLNDKNILPGINELLSYLKENGYKIAIGSSSKNAKFILDKIGLMNAFDVISDGTNINRSKPFPDVFIYAADKLNISYNNCAVVEDAVSGVLAAYNANMISFAIGDATNSEYATFKINNAKEIIDILKLQNQ